MQSIFAGYFQHRLRPANVFPFISKIIKRFKFAGKIGVTHLLFRILPDQCSCNILNWEKQSTFIYERWSAIEHSLEPVPVVYHIPISISIYISSTALQIAQPPFLCRFPHTNFELCGVRSRNLKSPFEFTALPVATQRFIKTKLLQIANFRPRFWYSWTKFGKICRPKWLEFSSVHITEKKYARNFLICEIRCWKIQSKLEEGRACDVIAALYLPSLSKGSKGFPKVRRSKTWKMFARLWSTGLITDQRQRKSL